MNERIKILRIKLKMSQKEFATAIGCSQPALSEYEKGNTIPTGNILAEICEKFNVDGTWLLTGKEPEQKTIDGLSENETKLIEAIRGLIKNDGN